MKIKYLSLLCIFLSVYVFALPQGFDSIDKPSAAPRGFNHNTKPNSIKGIKEIAQDGDYVLFKARFTGERTKENYYTFIDNDNIKVDVFIPDDNIVLYKNATYFLWGTVKRSWFNFSINLNNISDPL